jgi:hypothetical protein
MSPRHRCATLLVLAAAWPLAAPAQSIHFGRLFTTPSERQRLDAVRMGGAADTSGQPAAVLPDASAAAPPPPPPPAPLTVNGVVRRGDGRTTVWINQAPQTGSEVKTIPGTHQPTVAVPLPNGGQVQVKPGQQVDPATGAVHDVSH